MGKIHFFETLCLTPYLDHLLKSDLYQNWQKVSQDISVQLSGVYFMVLYNLYPVQGPKGGQKLQKFNFLTPYLDHLLKSDLHQNWHKISQDTPVQLSGVYFMLSYNSL